MSFLGNGPSSENMTRMEYHVARQEDRIADLEEEIRRVERKATARIDAFVVNARLITYRVLTGAMLLISTTGDVTPLIEVLKGLLALK